MKRSSNIKVPLACMDNNIRQYHQLSDYRELKIGGFQKQSLIDYPGHIADLIFTQGCNFKCRYCHNIQLIPTEQVVGTGTNHPDEILKWISTNSVLLDAVVITGGEPTIQGSLPYFIKQIRQLGLKVKLDTNGSNPGMLNHLLKNHMLDYIAMDIKAPLDLSKYREVAGKHLTEDHVKRVRRSISLLRSGQCKFEFRTTMDESLTIKDIRKIIASVSGKLFLQKLHYPENYSGNIKPCISENLLNNLFKDKPTGVTLLLRN